MSAEAGPVARAVAQLLTGFGIAIGALLVLLALTALLDLIASADSEPEFVYQPQTDCYIVYLNEGHVWPPFSDTDWNRTYCAEALP